MNGLVRAISMYCLPGQPKAIGLPVVAFHATTAFGSTVAEGATVERSRGAHRVLGRCWAAAGAGNHKVTLNSCGHGRADASLLDRRVSERDILTRSGTVGNEAVLKRGHLEYEEYLPALIDAPTLMERHFAETIGRSKRLAKQNKKSQSR